MSRSRAALLVAVAVAAVPAAAPATSGAAGANYRSCSGSYGPNGEPNGGFYRQIRAKRVSCDTARRVVRAYLKAGAGNRNVLGYRCRVTATPTTEADPNGGAKVLCVRAGGRRAVRTYGHP